MLFISAKYLVIFQISYCPSTATNGIITCLFHYGNHNIRNYKQMDGALLDIQKMRKDGKEN
jgi:hypothetical protein